MPKGARMRRIHLLLVVGLAQTMFFDQRTVSNVLKSSEKLMSCAQAGPVKGDHMLGRSYLDPTNVGVDGDNLRIRLPARTVKGARSTPTISSITAPTPPRA